MGHLHLIWGLTHMCWNRRPALIKTQCQRPGQRAIENHLNWAGLPATTFNSALQGRYENASVAFLHFAVNGLTLGLADLTEEPAAVNSQDFGQTLAHLNVPEGNFLMVPFLGPNTAVA